MAVAAVFIAAGAVKGVTGMGLPTVAVSLLGLWLPLGEVAAWLVLPALLTNLQQCRGPQLRPLLRALWPLWLGLVLATVALPAAWLQRAPFDARQVLGVVLVAYGAWGWWRPDLPRVPLPGSGWPAMLLAVSVGGLTGCVTAATAVFVLPLVPYLQALRLDKDTLVQALGLSFTVATLALALRVGGTGLAGISAAGAALATAAAFAGLWLGERLRRCIDARVFQKALSAVFVLLGVANLLR